jgi:hypothetical protein
VSFAVHIESRPLLSHVLAGARDQLTAVCFGCCENCSHLRVDFKNLVKQKGDSLLPAMEVGRLRAGVP